MSRKSVSGKRSELSYIQEFLASALAIVLFGFISTVVFSEPANQQLKAEIAEQEAVADSSRPKIQMAIILDTSNSMDGLIDQTRHQLWQVVNEFASATKNGQTPVLELALFEYGNDGLSNAVGHIRQLSGFTRELDAISEGLYSLTTYGGQEYSGFAIKTAVYQLQWSPKQSDLKAIFIAGNESFSQGPVFYKDAIKLANKNGISVNTIHAGAHQAGIDHGWQTAALASGGEYMSIDANRKVVHIVAPQDQKIAQLNNLLNQTYIPYGIEGKAKYKRQLELDDVSSHESAGLLAKRAKTKTIDFYSSAQWDLVDAMEEGEVTESSIAKINENSLPAEMLEMSTTERVEYIHQKARERRVISQRISELSEAREAYVKQAKKNQAETTPDISEALIGAIRKQASQKEFKIN